MSSEAIIEKILAMHTIAVVGLSPKAERPSNGVARYLLGQGYRVIPVNPGHEAILGLKCYPSLKDIPEPVEVVDVFRRAERALPVAEEAVAIGARALWLQLGIVNDEALRLAEAGGPTGGAEPLHQYRAPAAGVPSAKCKMKIEKCKSAWDWSLGEKPQRLALSPLVPKGLLWSWRIEPRRWRGMGR